MEIRVEPETKTNSSPVRTTLGPIRIGQCISDTRLYLFPVQVVQITLCPLQSAHSKQLYSRTTTLVACNPYYCDWPFCVKPCAYPVAQFHRSYVARCKLKYTYTSVEIRSVRVCRKSKYFEGSKIPTDSQSTNLP